MRDKIELLDRYLNSFIEERDDYRFFMGMRDYVFFMDNTPEIEKIANELPTLRIEEEGKLKIVESEAVEELITIREALGRFVDKKKIKDEALAKHLKDFDAWLEGKIVGSSPLPDALFRELQYIIEILIKLGFRKENSKYVQYLKDHPEIIEKYIFSPKTITYDSAKTVFNDKMSNELWGQFNTIALTYTTILDGKSRHAKMLEEANAGKERDNVKWWEAFNFMGVLGEWEHIKEKKEDKYKILFEIDKCRFYMKRLHNYLVERLLLQNQKEESGKESITDTISVPQSSTTMRPTLGIMTHRRSNYGYIQLFARGRRIKLGKMDTRQYRLIKCLFSPENKEIGASYTPNLHTVERVYDNISLPRDRVSGNHPFIEKKRIIENTIKEIQKIKDLQGYIDFHWETDKSKLGMMIHSKEG